MVKRTECEVYSRCVGYIRPISQWNEGIRQSYHDRVTFKIQGGKNESNNNRI